MTADDDSELPRRGIKSQFVNIVNHVESMLPDFDAAIFRQPCGPIAGIVVTLDGGQRRNFFQFNKNNGLADIAGMYNKINSCQGCDGLGPQQAVGVRDQADHQARARGSQLHLFRITVLDLSAAATLYWVYIEGGTMFPHLKGLNLRQWIDENRGNWGQRRVIWQDSDFIAFVTRGPNRRKDYHINPGDEIFYQLEGELNLHYLQDGSHELALLKAGDLFLLRASAPLAPAPTVHGHWSWKET